MKRVKAASVVLDFDLYPRNNVDAHNVRSIVDAILAGQEMPPVIIDRKSKRVVDGFHRVKAVLRADPEGELDVVEKAYRNDAAMFLDAMKYNATHGARLDPCDRTRCTIIAARLSIPLDAVAGALHMPIEKLGNLRDTRTARNGGGSLSIPLKRTIKHMGGRKLTKPQQAANEKLSGMNQAFYANQLILLIETKMIDPEDAKLFERLAVLAELLDGLLAKA